MEEQLVSFETAKLAKNKGFKRSSLLHLRIIPFYNKNGLLVYKFKGLLNPNIVYAPTQSLLQKWLREKHNIHVNLFIYHNTEDINIVYRCRIDYFINKVKQSHWLELGRYEDVLEMGLKQGLNYIKL